MSGLLRSRTSTSKNSPEATSRFPTPSSQSRAARARFAPLRLEPALALLEDQVSGLQNAALGPAGLRQAELAPDGPHTRTAPHRPDDRRTGRTAPAQKSTKPRQTRLRHPHAAHSRGVIHSAETGSASTAPPAAPSKAEVVTREQVAAGRYQSRSHEGAAGS